jgi:hypothetical protein
MAKPVFIRHLAIFLVPSLTLVMLLPSPVGGAEKKPKAYRVRGIAVAIAPAQVTIRDAKGNEVTMQTAEDFTRIVAVGAQVTAWYRQQDGACRLSWLEYPLENSFVSPQQFVPHIKKAVLLTRSDAGEAEELFQSIETFLQAKLAWTFKDRRLAEEVASRFEGSRPAPSEAAASADEPELPTTEEVRELLIRKIASGIRSEAVLETRIERVQAKFHSQVAHWDGVRQPVASKGTRTQAIFSPLPIDGHVPAATAVFRLWDAQGKLLWSNRRGFCVLALKKGFTDKFLDRPISEALKDDTSVQSWLTDVFASWLPEEGRGSKRGR